MKLKKLTSIFVLCFFLVGMFGSSVLAQKDIKNVTLSVDKAGSASLTIKFKDIKDAVWAYKHVSRMAAEDIVKGYSDGSFKPNKPVTRAEAVILAVKAAGLQEDVEAVASSVYLPFKDSMAVPAWAKNSIVVAVQKGFIENSGVFQPNKPASREWVAKLITTSFGLKEEALAKADVQLPFKDAAKISADSVGYIAVAMERNIIAGMPDGTFQPVQPVTRAQIAVMLGLTADQAGINIKKGKAEAIVLGTTVADDVYSQGTISLDFKNEALAQLTLPVAKDAVIYINDNQAKLSDITTGSRVEVIIKNNVVVYIEIQPVTVRGVAQSVYSNSVTILTRDGKQLTPKTYAVSSDVQVKFNGKKAAFAELKPGAFVILTLNEKDTVVSIKATLFVPKMKQLEKKLENQKEKELREQAKAKVREQVKEKVKEDLKEKAKEQKKRNA